MCLWSFVKNNAKETIWEMKIEIILKQNKNVQNKNNFKKSIVQIKNLKKLLKKFVKNKKNHRLSKEELGGIIV